MKFIAGLDIGTKKIGLVVGKIDKQRNLQIIDFQKGDSDGVQHGIIVDLAKAIKSILKIKQGLKYRRINSVFASINGKDVKSHFNQTALNLSPRGEEIRQSHLNKLLNKGLSVNLPLNRQIIHSLPLEYIVDGEGKINNPLGMTATRVEVRLHIISIRVGVVENLNKVINYSNWETEELIPISLACQYAICQDSYFLLLDIGSQLINLGISLNNTLTYCQSFPYEDYPDKCLWEIKEFLKKRGNYGRIKEIFVSGGGVLKDGLIEKIEEIFRKPTKIGNSIIHLDKNNANLGKESEIIDSPVYTVAVGLVKYGFKKRKEQMKSKGMLKKIKGWVEGYF